MQYKIGIDHNDPYIHVYTDSDCHEGLACFQRNGRKKVPGCKGRGGFGWDYCFRPEPDANIFLRKP